MPGRARHQHAVEQARDVGHRRRHEHGVRRAEAVHARHQRRLPAQAALRVQHRLGDPRRAGGEQDQGDVGGTAGAGPGGDGCTADGADQRRGVGDRLGCELQDERGVDLRQGRLDVGRAEGVQDRRGHRPDAPAGPRQDGGGQAVGHLPGHGVALVVTPRSLSPPATAATSASAWAAESLVLTVDDLAAAGGDAARRASARPRGRRAGGSARARLGTQVGRRRSVTAGHHTRAPLT